MLASYTCGGCQLAIHDKFMLSAMDKYWHEQCLRCGCCQTQLGSLGVKLYVRQGMILCKADYHRLFGQPGCCSACREKIPATEMVMKAGDKVYHLNCFSCNMCNYRFCVGDKYYLNDNKILCQYDYEERLMFLQAAYSDKSLTELTKNIQQLGDFEPMDDRVTPT